MISTCDAKFTVLNKRSLGWGYFAASYEAHAFYWVILRFGLFFHSYEFQNIFVQFYDRRAQRLCDFKSSFFWVNVIFSDNFLVIRFLFFKKKNNSNLMNWLVVERVARETKLNPIHILTSRLDINNFFRLIINQINQNTLNFWLKDEDCEYQTYETIRYHNSKKEFRKQYAKDHIEKQR